MPNVKANKITMNYEQQGTAEPLVLIPYLAADNACYAFQVADYAKHFTCISVDPRGAGATDKPAGAYSTELFADDRRPPHDGHVATGLRTKYVPTISLATPVSMNQGEASITRSVLRKMRFATQLYQTKGGPKVPSRRHLGLAFANVRSMCLKLRLTSATEAPDLADRVAEQRMKASEAISVLDSRKAEAERVQRSVLPNGAASTRSESELDEEASKDPGRDTAEALWIRTDLWGHQRMRHHPSPPGGYSRRS